VFAMRYTAAQPALRQRLKVQRGERDFVTALARGLERDARFSGQQVEQLALPTLPAGRATARHHRSQPVTLCALGYMEESDKRFRPPPKVLTLAQAYLSSNLLPRIARPLGERVSADCRIVSVSILHETEVIYVARSTNKRLSALLGDVGSRRPPIARRWARFWLAHCRNARSCHFRAVELQAADRPHDHRRIRTQGAAREIRKQGSASATSRWSSI